jgi:hypothetical protein
MANPITQIPARYTQGVTSTASLLIPQIPDKSIALISNRQSAESLYIRIFTAGAAGYMDSVYYYDLLIAAGEIGVVSVGIGIEVWALVTSDATETIEVTVTNGEPAAGLFFVSATGGGGGPGPQGPPGTRGSLWYEGSGNPGVIGGQANNDLYLDTSTSNIWQLQSGTWVLLFSLGVLAISNHYVNDEIHVGTGSSITLSNTPIAGTVSLFLNGQRLTIGYDYSITGAAVTLLTYTTDLNDIVVASYYM